MNENKIIEFKKKFEKGYESLKKGRKYSLENLDFNKVYQAIEKIVKKSKSENKFVFYGEGRSGDVARSSARRFTNEKLNSHYLRDAGCPPIEEGDVLILISGSGITSNLVRATEKGIELGAEIIFITSKITPDNKIANIIIKANNESKHIIIEVQGRTKNQKKMKTESYDVKQLTKEFIPDEKKEEDEGGPIIFGTQYEKNAGDFLDILCLELMDKLDLTEEDIDEGHQKIE